MNCASCDYWYPDEIVENPDKYEYGQCRRHAPIRDVSDIVMRTWPVVLAQDWCGDYQRHPTRRLVE